MADKDILQEFREYFAQRRKSTITLNGKQVKAYDIRTITLGQFRMLIACGNDSRNNQIRVTKSGIVYLSEDIVGAEQLDDRHVIPLYYALKRNWTEGCNHAYIDSF